VLAGISISISISISILMMIFKIYIDGTGEHEKVMGPVMMMMVGW
jgi:K+ transporter